jgi:hypothetical protein
MLQVLLSIGYQSLNQKFKIYEKDCNIENDRKRKNSATAHKNSP